MVFYNESGKRVVYDCTNRIGGELYGDVYKLSEEECIKICKDKNEAPDKEVLMLIRSLMLKNYYEIYDLLYRKNGVLKAYTMKYYKNEDIDILTMPTEYTLDNLYNLYTSVEKLTKNNIFISDMHTGNIILSSDKITVIDVDLYTINKYYNSRGLRTKNSLALEYLFREIFLEALNEYHIEYPRTARDTITELFTSYSGNIEEKVCKELSTSKYPIDYVRKKIKNR